MWNVLHVVAGGRDVVLGAHDGIADGPSISEGAAVAVASLDDGRVAPLPEAETPCALLGDGRSLVTFRGDGITCWDLPRRTPRLERSTRGVRPRMLSSSKGTRPGVFVDSEAESYLWDLLTGEAISSRNDALIWSRGDTQVRVGDGEVCWSEGGVTVEVQSDSPGRGEIWASPRLDVLVAQCGQALVCVKRGEGASQQPWMGCFRALAWSADGRLLAVTDGDTTRVWDVHDDQERWALEASDLYAEGLCFSPDGRGLHAVGYRGLVTWDLATGVEGTRVHVGPLTLSGVACSPDGGRLVAWVKYSTTSRTKVVLIEGGRGVEEQIPGEHWAVVGADFDARGEAFAVTLDPRFEFLHVHRRQGESRWEGFGALSGTSVGCEVVRADQVVFGANGPHGHELRVFDVGASDSRWVRAEAVAAPCAAGARTVVATRRDQTALVRIDLATGALLDEVDFSAATARVALVALSRDERRVAVALSTGALLLFAAE